MSDPGVFEQQGAEGLSVLGARLEQLERELEDCFSRWEALE